MSEWTDFEKALYEVAKQQPPLHEADYERPRKYPNGATRNKAYIKLQDAMFYCYKCGAIPIMQYNSDTKEYRAKCPVCRMTGEPQKDKSLAYKAWNDEVKRNLR